MKQLAFQMQRQERTNWCWTAVATSVSRFRNTMSPWTQCTLASAELQQACCPDGTCNVDWFLNRALDRTGNLQSFSSGSELMSTIKAQVDADLPLGVRIQWQGGGGHFVAITGYDVAANVVTVRDPLEDEPVALDYDLFVTSYEGIGSWSHSYFTR